MNTIKKPTLLVMAAGMGSRYGGTKQIEGFGPNGETIMDYSLFDAIREGFGKVVFIVREEIRRDIETLFLPKLDGKVATECVVQSLDRLVPSQYRPINRKKPWGTAHAVLCSKDVIDEPFAVINADDFYGRASFRLLADFLKNTTTGHHAMVGYRLGDVLSEHGSVSRGIVETSEGNMLRGITEVPGIVHKEGYIVSETDSMHGKLSPDLNVSMNCWGFMPDVFDVISGMFEDFVEKNRHDPGAEMYIGMPVTHIIEKGIGHIHIIPGGENWFGITYKQDKETVCRRIGDLVRGGTYPLQLWDAEQD